MPGSTYPAATITKVNSAEECSKKSVRTPEDCAADNQEYVERSQANIAWLKDSFRIAKDKGAIGVMVIIQADPGFDLRETEDVNEQDNPGFDGYADFLQTLAKEAKTFDGQAVLVHGDTHFFKVDKPLYSQSDLLKNFARVETFGSPNVHWVRVTVDPRSRNVFTFEPMIVPGN